MPTLCFFSVTNNRYIPGTVATLSSIRRFHPECPIWVFAEIRHKLSPAQEEFLRALPGVHYVRASDVKGGVVKEEWQLKAHAALFLAEQAADLGSLVQVDSDAVLCSDISEFADGAIAAGVPSRGQDGKGTDYNAPEFAPYYAPGGTERSCSGVWWRPTAGVVK